MLPSTVFLVHLTLTAAKVLPLTNELSMRESLSKCILTASEIYFKENEIITLSLASSNNVEYFKSPVVLDRLLLLELFTKSRWSVLVKKPSNSTTFPYFQPHEYKKSDNYIIQIRTFEEVDRDLKDLKQHPSWNPHAKFMIIAVTAFEDTLEVVTLIIQKLWKLDVLNGVIIFPSGNNSSKFYVYTWFPYSYGRCGNYFGKVELLSECCYGEISNTVDWFPNKIPFNLNNCPIKVQTKVFPPFVMEPESKVENITDRFIFNNGLEVRLLNLVAEIANFSIEYTMSANANIISLLMEGEVDVGVGSLSATMERHAILDSTGSYFLDSLTFCVPHAEEKPQWKKLSQIMTISIWLSIAFSMFIIFSLIYLSGIAAPSEMRPYKSIINIFLNILAIGLANSVKVQPKTTTVRYFVMMWVILSLILGTAYQSYLMSSLTKPDYEKQIKTIDDILGSDLDMLFLENTKKYFQQPKEIYGIQTRQILARWKVCNDLDECLHRTAYRTDSCVAASRIYTSFAQDRYRSSEGLPSLYCFRHSIVTFPVVIYMRKGFPLRKRIHTIIDNINTAGFLQWWEKNLFDKRKFNLTQNEDLQYKQDIFLGLNHLQPIFIVLIVGLVTSTAIFILEVAIANSNLHW